MPPEKYDHFNDTKLIMDHTAQLAMLKDLPESIKEINQKLDRVIIWQAKRDAEKNIIVALIGMSSAGIGSLLGKLF
jgi:hypothetical protein